VVVSGTVAMFRLSTQIRSLAVLAATGRDPALRPGALQVLSLSHFVNEELPLSDSTSTGFIMIYKRDIKLFISRIATGEKAVIFISQTNY
jgi:hypothetical protein